MLFKRIILTAVSVLGILLFFKSDYYSRWLDVFILPENTKIEDQFQKTGVEERKEYRFGNLYSLCQYMKKTLDTTAFRNGGAIVLLPPNDYLKAKGVEVFHMPEPAEFYYHIGIKTVWTTSPDVDKANWAIVISGKNSIAFIPIRSAEERKALLETYKNYKPGL